MCPTHPLSTSPENLKIRNITSALRTILKMLLSKGKITEDLVDMLMKWRHSGFNVFCGPRIQPGDEEAMENLARYIIRASFSQERMTYIPDQSIVVYKSKDAKEEKIFDALEWLVPPISGILTSRTRANRWSVTMDRYSMLRSLNHYKLAKVECN